MPCNLIPVHSLLELQPKFTATGVADVPSIFLYVTPLIVTPELCNKLRLKLRYYEFFLEHHWLT